jgi:lysophospholipase L1-like esterase
LSTGRLNALPDKYVIDETEAHLITQKIFDFDEKIKTVAEANDLAYVDMYDFFRQVDNGIKLNNVTFTLDFLEGSVFSLDGLHPTAKGNALVANQFINAINLQYGASLREADANAYPGIKFP